MQTLQHNQRFKTTMDTNGALIFVAVEGDEDYKALAESEGFSAFDYEVDRAKQAFRPAEHCGCVQRAAMLTDDPMEVKEAEAAKSRAEFEAAPLVADGELIMAYGRVYQARYTGAQYSDPVKFRLVNGN